ncbi:MAG: tetratricopeptide repeat protein [Candidatus Andersenbacteria bacterium]|nr:tetratricopeptide repeat protein [Candidatus Andersenbacteria bacterium]
MLYDILPPLLLLFSFGGIIVLIARAMMKVRAREVHEEIQAHVESDAPVHAETVIGPNKGNVHVAKNRLLHVGALLGAGIAKIGPATKSFIASYKASALAKKEQKAIAKKPQKFAAPVPAKQTVNDVKEKIASGMKGIQIPEVSIHEKIEQFSEKGKQGFSFLRNTVASRIPHVKKGMQAVRDQVVSSMPVRKQAVATGAVPTPIIRLVHQESVSEPKRGIMSQMMQRPKEETVLEKAERMISENNFDSAEDLLVPYIMKHATDTKAYMLLGRSAMGKGSWDEAVEIFQQVLKMSNEEVEAQALLGHCALQAGKFTMAMQALQRARDNDPENISIREDLLFIARRMDNKVVVRGVLEELEALKQKS